MKQRIGLVLASILAAAMIGQSALAQGPVTRNVFDYGSWISTVQTGNSSTGASTIVVTSPASFPFNPFQVGVPIVVGSETVTITSASGCQGPGACTVGATFTALHLNAELITSATYGLQEAILNMPSIGGTVVIDSRWRGITANITAATGNTAVSISDQRTSPAVLYTWNGSAYAVTSQTITAAAINSALGYIPQAYAGSAGIPYASAAGTVSVANRTQVASQLGNNIWYADILGTDLAKAAALSAANSTNSGQIISFIPNFLNTTQTTYTTNGLDLTTTSGACISLDGPGLSQLPGMQSLLLYTGTAGNPIIQKTATKFNGGCFIRNLIIDGNNSASDVRIDNAFRWNLENLVIQGMASGGASPYDAALVIGPTTQSYEMKLNHVTVQQKSQISSLWGSFTVTSSAGAITAYAINSGGRYYNNGTVAPIPVINGCSVLPSPLPTFTFTSNGDGTFAISGISGGLGGTCTGAVYMSAPELATGPNFGIDYFNMTDSTAIDTVVAGVGKIAGIQHNHGANTFISEHVYVGQPSAIQENATNKVYGLEADSMTSQAVNVFGHSAYYDGITTVFNNTQNPSGYGKYAVVNFNTGEINNKFKGLTCSGTAGPNSGPYRSFGVMYGSGGGRLVNGDELEYTNDCLNVNNIYTARTIGDHLYDGVNTFGFTYASAYASTSTLTVTGVPYTAGTATTNFPATYLNAGATAPTTFSTAGTMFGINTPSGFTGNLIDAHINGAASAFTLGANGNLATSGTLTGTTINATANINATTGTITGQSVTATGVLSGASLSLSGSASPEITVASSMATSGSAFQYLATSLGTSTSLDFDFGATTATNDLVRMRFLHNAAGGGTTNQLTMGFAGNLFFNLFASGDVSIGTATDNSKQLHTTGAAQFDGGMLPSNTSATMTFFGKGVTASIGGSALVVGTCATGTATVSGATAGMTVLPPSPTDGTSINSLIVASATVTSANTVTVELCPIAAVTPTAKQYNVTVIN